MCSLIILQLKVSFYFFYFSFSVKFEPCKALCELSKECGCTHFEDNRLALSGYFGNHFCIWQVVD